MKIVDGLTEAARNAPLIRLHRASGLTGCAFPGKAGFLNPGGSSVATGRPRVRANGRGGGARQRVCGAWGVPGVNPSYPARLRGPGDSRERAGDRSGDRKKEGGE